VLKQVEDAADVRMRDFARELDLTQKALMRCSVKRDLGTDRFDGDLAA